MIEVRGRLFLNNLKLLNQKLSMTDEKNISKLSAMYHEPRGHPYLFCVYSIKGDKCEVVTFQPLGHQYNQKQFRKPHVLCYRM